MRTEQFAQAWQTATDAEIDPAKLQALLLEFGGDLEIDDEGGAAWRFPNIELELGALALLRAQAAESEREVGEVEFTSLPAAATGPHAETTTSPSSWPFQ